MRNSSVPRPSCWAGGGGTQSQNLSKTLAGGNLAGHFNHCLGVAKGQFDAAGVLGGDFAGFKATPSAQAMVAPQEMVSMPYWLQSWLA